VVVRRYLPRPDLLFDRPGQYVVVWIAARLLSRVRIRNFRCENFRRGESRFGALHGLDRRIHACVRACCGGAKLLAQALVRELDSLFHQPDYGL